MLKITKLTKDLAWLNGGLAVGPTDDMVYIIQRYTFEEEQKEKDGEDLSNQESVHE